MASLVEEVDEVHKELAYWDAMTAEAVVPMIKRSAPYDPGVVDFVSGLAGLRYRLVVLAERNDMDRERLDAYVEYADALAAVNLWGACVDD
jgi:hypothetical protein